MAFDSIAVLGLGKVGKLAAELLAEAGFRVVGFDGRQLTAPPPLPVERRDLSSAEGLAETLEPFDGVLSCLPYHLNLAVAATAHRLGLHYFDLTEDVPTTQAIREMSASATAVMAPQCGLAPGFIGIVGAHLAEGFERLRLIKLRVGAHLAEGFERLRLIKLRVGALPQHPSGLLGYAFNWSPEGVVNEYLNDCEVFEEGRHKWISPMEWVETVYVGGVKLEAFTTSGGLGTMCETYLGRVDNLDYKSLRYPGHVGLMNFFFHELLIRERRDEAGAILTHAKPPVDDVVYLHAAAEGEADGRLQRCEFVRAYHPVDVAGTTQTAIAWTTSASAAAVIEMVRGGALYGGAAG